ncbi:MAG: phosphoesterase [Candidatus Altiarchaeales archaeon HGW-Altiarchaeales-3]|nr:MAG: phosphoesterase [Candidatus Altiarchaeales archaeon HGW-Altiarchaeales-3]
MQDEFIKNYLENHFSLFESEEIYYLCYPGNDDLRIFDELHDEICNKFSFVVSLAQRKFKIGDYEFIGMNYVVDYPFRLKDRCRKDTEDYVFQEQFGTGLLSTPGGWQEIDDWFSYANKLPTIEDELNKLIRPDNMANAVYVIHIPPYKLGLDECGNGTKVGSKAVYDFLLKNQPMLSLHGHIHESPDVSGKWYARLGRTVCIQPGQLDEFTYVWLDISTMEFDRIKI